MSEEKKDFVVKDRRIFAQDRQEDEAREGEKTDAAAAEQTPARDDAKKDRAAAEQPEAAEPRQASPDREAQDEQPQFPEMNFPTFVASLNASALLHLGVIEDPTTGKKAKNLPMAKQTIDILSMLEQKTAGNLTGDEENLIKNILYDLRIMYVKEMG